MRLLTYRTVYSLIGVLFSCYAQAGRIDVLDQTVSSPTEEPTEQSKGPQRSPTRNENFLGFGAVGLTNLGVSGVGFGFTAGHAWDINTALIKVFAQVDVNGPTWFATASVGGNYFFSTSDVAPYLSADFGAGAAKINGPNVLSGESAGGFALGGGGGVFLLRTADVNLDLGYRTAWLLRSTSLGMPLSHTIRLAIYF